MAEDKRLVKVTQEDIESGRPIESAVRRTWPEAKFVTVHNGAVGINFTMDNPGVSQGCFYVELPQHINTWHRTFLRAMDNPDEKIIVLPIVWGMVFDSTFIKPRYVERLNNDTTLRPKCE